MNMARFLTLIGIAGLAVILAAGSPLSYVKADHCHTTQTQVPSAPPEDAKSRTPVRSREAAVAGQRSTRTQSNPAGSTNVPASVPTASIEQIYSRDLPLAIESLERAVKAVESGDKQAELAELSKTVTMLASIRESLGKQVKAPSTPSMPFRRGSAGVLSEASESKDLSPSTPSAPKGASRAQSRDLANSRCPIMGSAINADSIAANLTRDYNGQKIGFCCAGCPAAWDKLTDTEKQAKLSGVKS